MVPKVSQPERGVSSNGTLSDQDAGETVRRGVELGRQLSRAHSKALGALLPGALLGGWRFGS